MTYFSISTQPLKTNIHLMFVMKDLLEKYTLFTLELT